ncbi:MAG: hypothetical protein VW338_17105 [Rhodospirillaceae bacterium]
MMRIQGAGDAADADFDLYAPYYWNNMVRYQEDADRAFLEDQGYSPDEIAGMMQAGNWGDYMASPDQYNNLYLGAGEMDEIRGNPYGALDYLNPDSLYGYANDAQARQYEAMDRDRGNIVDIDPSLYQISDAFGGRQEADIGRYTDTAMGSISDRLRLDPNFAEDYPMSDAEVTGHAELAGRAANTRYAADLDEIKRRARASGGTSSLATAALSDRMRRQGAIAGADAMASARLDALATQREQKRMAEQMRIMSEQGYTDREIAAALGSGDLALGARADLERMRMAGGAAYGDARQRGGLAMMDAGLDTARDVANRGIGVGQYVTNYGGQYRTIGDQAASERGRYIAGNRQDTGRTNIGQRFEQGVNVADRNYGRQSDIAGQRLQSTRNRQNYYAQQNANNANQFAGQQDLRLRNASLYGNLAAGAADDWNSLKRSGRLTGFTNAMSGALAQGITGGFTNPLSSWSPPPASVPKSQGPQ